MNEVFLKDRMARDNADYEGFGVGSARKLSKKEIRKLKFDEIRLPLLILGFMIGVFLLTLHLHLEELIVYFKGTAVTVPYNPGDDTTRFDAPNGNRYIINVSKAGCKKEEITLYYMEEDYQGAIVMTMWWLFPICYLLSIGVGGAMAWYIYKVFHNSGHATQKKGNGKFEN